MRTLKIDPKPPQELFIKNGDEYVSAKKWRCSECGNVNDEYWSDKCCKAPLCESCKKTHITKMGWTECDECRRDRYRKMDEDYMNSLPIVKYNGEAVYDIESDKYHQDLDSFADDHMDDDVEDRPEFVEICRSIPIGKTVCVSDIIEHIAEKVTEELEDDIELIDLDKLEKDIQEFLDKQTQWSIYDRAQKKVKVDYEDI